MIQKSLHITEPFRFEGGAVLDDLTVVYHVSEEVYDGRKKVVWVCHALTANSDVEDWWPQMYGPGKLLDPQKYFIVCVNMLGSAYGTSGPASPRPSDGRPYFFDFPAFTIRDMVQTFTYVRREVGIDSIHLLLGSSIGGFQAVEWSLAEPGRVRNLVLMATDVRISPWLTAEAETQRMALEADPTFREAADLSGGRAGLRCARAQAILSYRSYDGYQRTQSEADPDTLFAGRAASYQRHQGDKFISRFDAYSYWSLCNTLDSHNVGRGRGGVEAALSQVRAKTLVVGIDSDCLFPARVMAFWAPYIPGSRFVTISSAFGHDGFLLESGQMTALFTPILEEADPQ